MRLRTTPLVGKGVGLALSELMLRNNMQVVHIRIAEVLLSGPVRQGVRVARPAFIPNMTTVLIYTKVDPYRELTQRPLDSPRS